MTDRWPRKSWRVLLFALIALVVVGAFLPARGGLAQEPTTVRIGSDLGDVGDYVTVRLEVQNVPAPGLGAYIVDISYDPAIVDPTSCAADPDGVLDTELCNLNFERNGIAPDRIRVGGFQIYAGLTGTVALADVTFQIVGAGVSDLMLNVVELTDTNAASIPRSVQNGSIYGGGGAMVVAVDPPQKNALIADGQFAVDVVVDDAANLGAFEFAVDFDPAVIAFVGVAEGPFLSSTGRTTMCFPLYLDVGSIQFGCASSGMAAGPNGSGVLATITFSPVAVGTSPVDLHNVMLCDPLGDGFPCLEPQDGSVEVVSDAPPTPTPTLTGTPTPTPCPGGVCPTATNKPAPPAGHSRTRADTPTPVPSTAMPLTEVSPIVATPPIAEVAPITTGPTSITAPPTGSGSIVDGVRWAWWIALGGLVAAAAISGLAVTAIRSRRHSR